MNFIVYARKSSDEKIASYSLGTQTEAGRDYVKAASGEVIAEFQENFTGTVPIEERPEGRKAFELLNSGKADALVAYRFDRIARPPEEGDEWDIPPLIRGLAKIGKEIHTVNRGRIGTSFADLLLAMLDAKTAGDERRQIVERTTRGRRAKARAGKVVGNGPRLFGYDFKDDSYAIREDEARQIRKVYELYITPTDDGNRLGTWGVTWEMEKVTRRKWPIAKVTRILHNPAYKGEWHYADAVVPIPAIVDAQTWNEAQRILKSNLTNSPRNVKRAYLLRGLVYCGCGCKAKYICMSIQRKYKEQLFYYPCYHNRRRYGGRCAGRAIQAQVIEREAWEYVREVFKSEQFDDIVRRISESSRDEAATRLERIAEIDAELKELDAEAERLAGNVAGGIVGKKVEARIVVVNARHEALETERAELMKQKGSGDTKDKLRRFIELREAYVYDVEFASEERKRQIVEAIGLRVTMKHSKGIITSDFGVTREFPF